MNNGTDLAGVAGDAKDNISAFGDDNGLIQLVHFRGEIIGKAVLLRLQSFLNSLFDLLDRCLILGGKDGDFLCGGAGADVDALFSHLIRAEVVERVDGIGIGFLHLIGKGHFFAQGIRHGRSGERNSF